MKKLYISILAVAFSFNIASSQTFDVGVTAILDPAPGSTVASTFNDTMTFMLQNFGDTIFTGTDILFGVLVDGVLMPTGYTLPLGVDFPPNTAALVTGVVDLASLNLNDGIHTVCISTANLTDVNLANDSACGNYTISGTPPVGIESILGQKSAIFLSNGQLNVDVTNANIVGSASLTVYNMAGILIYSEELSGNGQVTAIADLSDQATGVYVVRLLSNGQMIEARKLMK